MTIVHDEKWQQDNLPRYIDHNAHMQVDASNFAEAYHEHMISVAPGFYGRMAGKAQRENTKLRRVLSEIRSSVDLDNDLLSIVNDMLQGEAS